MLLCLKCRYFSTFEGKLIGTKLPGLKKAVAQCIAAHNAQPHKWLRMIGWDAMFLSDDKNVVFFEGM